MSRARSRSSRRGRSDSPRSNIHANGFDDEEFMPYAPDVGTDSHWKKCRKMVSDYDDERCKRWELEINNLLIFAGLFSAVVTPFVVEAIKLVQEDPQALRINAFAILSLLIALISVVLGIFCLQWIREYHRKDYLSHPEYLKRRQVRFDGLEAWKVPQLVSLLPVLLISAVILFFICLVDFFNHIHRTLSIIVGATVGVAMILLISTTILPSLTLLFNISTKPEKPVSAQCPYKSAQSRAFLRLVNLFLRLFIPLEGRHWGDIEPRRNPARFDNLKQAMLCENWSHYDAISGFLRLVLDDSPLRWAATRFNQTYSAVVTIFRCFQDVDVELVWQTYSSLGGAYGTISREAQTDPEIDRLLSSEALINYFNGVSEVRHSPPFVRYHLSLYNRIVESGVPFFKLKDVYGYLPQCPDLSWREYGELGSLRHINIRLRDRTLNNLLSLIRNQQHRMVFPEIRMILTLFWWILSSPARHLSSPSDRGTFNLTKTMDDIFQPLQDRIANIPRDEEHGHICVAFIDQLIFPIAYYNEQQHPVLLSNLSHLRNNDSFKAFLSGLWSMPVFQGQMQKVRRPEAWNAFLKNAALAYNESTKMFEEIEGDAASLFQSPLFQVPPRRAQAALSGKTRVTVDADEPYIGYTTEQIYLRRARHRTPSFTERQLIIKGSRPYGII